MVWTVPGGEEGIFGWEFDLTVRDGFIVERLKVGTPTEMSTIYPFDKGKLFANHYCQLYSQASLTAISSVIDGDRHFECNGQVGNTVSHDELHMHVFTSKTIWCLDGYDGERKGGFRSSLRTCSNWL